MERVVSPANPVPKRLPGPGAGVSGEDAGSSGMVALSSYQHESPLASPERARDCADGEQGPGSGLRSAGQGREISIR